MNRLFFSALLFAACLIWNIGCSPSEKNVPTTKEPATPAKTEAAKPGGAKASGPSIDGTFQQVDPPDSGKNKQK
jgi:hypothetical protein